MKNLLILLALLSSPVWAAIARTGSCSATATSCNLSATTSGDLIIVFSFHTSSTTSPSCPSGGHYTWTCPTGNWVGNTTGGGTNVAFRAGCTKSDGTVGSDTWTNATSVVAISYSGTAIGTAANCNTTGVGGTSTTSAKSSTSASFNLLTMSNAQGTSLVAGFLGDSASSVCNPVNTTFPGLERVSATGTIMGDDTNGVTNSWPTTTCTVSSSSWETFVAEILDASCGSGWCLVASCRQVSGGSSLSSLSCSSTINLTAGNVLYIGAGEVGSSGPISSVSDGGTNTYTVVSGSATTGGGNAIESAYSVLTGSVTGATITVTYTAAASNLGFVAIEYQNSGNTISLDTSSNCTAATATSCTTASFTNATANELNLLYAATSIGNAFPCTPGTNYSMNFDICTNTNEFTSGSEVTENAPSGSQTAQSVVFTGTGSVIGTLLSFQATAAAPTGSKERKLEQLGENL